MTEEDLKQIDALRGYAPEGWMVDELHKLSKERDELHRIAYSWAKAGGKP